MKKVLLTAVSLLLAAACLCSCGKREDPTTPAVPEETEATVPALDEMCPPTYQRDLPVKIETDYEKTDKSGFTEIKAENAMIDGLAADKIYRDENGREYYLITDGTVVLTFLENDDAYSAFYRENGKLKYFVDSETGWHFKDDGSVDMVSYTYVNPKGSEVISYYEPDGTRIAISAAGTYYDDNFDEMSNERQLELTKRIGGTEASQNGEENASAAQ